MAVNRSLIAPGVLDPDRPVGQGVGGLRQHRRQGFAGQAPARAELARVAHAPAGLAGVDAEQVDQQRGRAVVTGLGRRTARIQFSGGRVLHGDRAPDVPFDMAGELQHLRPGQHAQVGGAQLGKHPVQLFEQGEGFGYERVPRHA
jgi:hypothetical protein